MTSVREASFVKREAPPMSEAWFVKRRAEYYPYLDHDMRFTRYASRDTLHEPRFTLHASREKGAALLIAVILMIVIAALGAAYFTFVGSGWRSAVYETQRNQAFWIAEAGLQRGILYMKTDLLEDTDWYDYGGTVIYPAVPFGDGSYTVTLFCPTTSPSDIDVQSAGTVAGYTRTLQQTVSQAGDVSASFEYVIRANKDPVDFDHSTGMVNGDVSAKGSVKNYSGMTINGDITDKSKVAFPTVNIRAYKSMANHVVNGDYAFSGKSDGIWYVNHNVTINSGAVINGSVICNGDVKFARKAQNVTLNPSSGMPAIVAKGNIYSRGLNNSTINGLLYVYGKDKKITFDYASKVQFNGTMLSSTAILIRHGSDLTITYDGAIRINPPPNFTGGAGIGISLSLWKEIP